MKIVLRNDNDEIEIRMKENLYNTRNLLFVENLSWIIRYHKISRSNH